MKFTIEAWHDNYTSDYKDFIANNEDEAINVFNEHMKTFKGVESVLYNVSETFISKTLKSFYK